MNCPQCNTPYEPGAMFCDNCGAALPQPGAQAPTAVYVPPAPSQQPAGFPPPAQQQPPVAYMPPVGAQQPPAGFPPAAQQPFMPAAPGAGANCSQCGMALTPGAAFCDNCGAPVSASPQSAYQPPVAQPPVYQPPIQQPPYQVPVQQPPYQPQAPYQPPVYGTQPRLVVQATNAPIAMPVGKTEYLVGREDPVSNIFPDVDMSPHGGDEGGVSRRHARMFQQGGQWFVEDLNTTNFTYVNNQKVQPGAPMPLPNGCELRFGRVKVTFYAQ